MNCTAYLTARSPLSSTVISFSCSKKKSDNLHAYSCRTIRVFCASSSSYPDIPLTSGLESVGNNNATLTGGAYDFGGAETSVTRRPLTLTKTVVLIRHGLSSWNEESRIQGSSNLSVLTEKGVRQAERCRSALVDTFFDQCFSSPISRAKTMAEVIWEGRDQPLIFHDTLKEAHLFFLEGMKNVDAKHIYPKEFTSWREDPSSFSVDGVYPLREVWKDAREAWNQILLSEGETFLVVTHKSILRALICTALGLGPERFRAFEVNNGGVSVFSFNKQGEAMLQSLNMTAHLYDDHVYHFFK